jgi:hypothetical protein
VEAKIFEESHLPWLQHGDDAFCFGTDAILSEDNVSTTNSPT